MPSGQRNRLEGLSSCRWMPYRRKASGVDAPDICGRTPQLVKQIRLFARDHLPQRLKLKPARLVCPYLLPRRQSAFPHDQHGFARGLRQELRMTATVQRNEPPDCFIHSLSYSQQPVVLQDGRLVIP